MIRISSKIHGIEVGGMRHPMQVVNYTEDQITVEQLAEFQANENLTVEIDEPVALVDNAKTKKTKQNNSSYQSE